MIVFGVPIKDKVIYEKYLEPSLKKAKGQKHVFLLDGDAGICSKYNELLENVKHQLKDDDVVCFIHDDTVLVDPLIPKKVEMYFKYKPNVALAGVIGARVYHKNNGGGWWHCNRTGGESAGHIIQGSPDGEYPMNDNKGMFDDMVIVDGCIMFMPGSIARWFRFDSETFKGYHFYDCDACFSLLSKGFDIGTVDVTVKHESIGELKPNWYESKEIFLNKWKDLPNIITKGTFEKI